MTRPDEHGRSAISRPTAAESEVWAQSTEEVVGRAIVGLFGRDSLYMLVWALQLLGAAAVSPLITRIMTADEFGAVAACIAVMQILIILAGLGLRAGVQRQYSEPGGEADSARLLLLTIVVSIVVTVLAHATGRIWSNLLGFESYSATLQLTVCWAGISAVTNAALALLRSQDRLLVFSCVSLLQSVAAAAASLILVTLVQATAAMFVLAQLILQIVAAVLALAVAPPKLLRMSDRKLVSNALTYSLPLIPSVLSTFVLTTSDRLIVQAELGASEVARYQVAYNVGEIPIILLGVLSNSWMPRIFALRVDSERAAVLAASRDALYRILIPVIVGLSIGSPIVLRLWAPLSYRPDELLIVTALVIVSAVPYAVGLSATRVLLADGRTISIAISTGCAALVNLLLNLMLVPRWGLTGSATATLLSYFIMQCFLTWKAATEVRLRRTPRLSLLGVGVAMAVSLLVAGLPTTNQFLILRGVGVVVCLAWFGCILVRLARGRRYR